MHEPIAANQECACRRPLAPRRRERGVQLVVGLTAATMVIEIMVGHATGSMALLADGWHMATHVGALGLASLAYWVSRRFAGHRAFAFGTGKVRALASYTSAAMLGLVGVVMAVESFGRLLRPGTIDFVTSLPVAVLGLVVNLVSVLLLHDEDDDHDHDHSHDHNHRAALLHVVADTFTSGLAIVAILGGRFLGWNFLDALSGVLGGVLILKWGIGLLRSAGFELLDMAPSPDIEDGIRTALEALDDVRVLDLHVWPLGGGARSCVVTLKTSTNDGSSRYRAALAPFQLAHLTIEVQRCEIGHEQTVAA
jgi:cation diffusion facilitator family transporter